MDNNVADGPEHIVVWEAAQQLADTDEVTSGHGRSPGSAATSGLDL